MGVVWGVALVGGTLPALTLPTMVFGEIRTEDEYPSERSPHNQGFAMCDYGSGDIRLRWDGRYRIQKACTEAFPCFQEPRKIHWVCVLEGNEVAP